jgi:hypothetical protein
MVLGLIGFGTFLVFFSLSPSIWAALPMLAMVGFSNQNYLTSNNTLLQMNVDEEYRGRVLAALLPQLPPDLLFEALAIARTITDQEYRAQILATLAPQLPPDLLPEALIAARTIKDERYRAKSMVALAPLLPEPERGGVLAEALAAARAIDYEGYRAEVLAALAPQLPSELLPDTLTATRAIKDEEYRAQVLAALPLQLPPHFLPECFETLLEDADRIGRGKLFHVLAGLTPLIASAAGLVALREYRRAISDAGSWWP